MKNENEPTLRENEGEAEGGNFFGGEASRRQNGLVAKRVGGERSRRKKESAAKRAEAKRAAVTRAAKSVRVSQIFSVPRVLSGATKKGFFVFRI